MPAKQIEPKPLKDLTLKEYKRATGATYATLKRLLGVSIGSVYNYCYGAKPHPALQKQITKRTGGIVNKF